MPGLMPDRLYKFARILGSEEPSGSRLEQTLASSSGDWQSAYKDEVLELPLDLQLWDRHSHTRIQMRGHACRHAHTYARLKSRYEETDVTYRQ